MGHCARSVRLASLIVFAGAVVGGCAGARAPEGAAAPAPASPARVGLLQQWMTGTFTNTRQARSDPENFRDVRLVSTRVWPERADGVWLYVEQAMAGELSRPYRQRVYCLSAEADGTVVSRVYALPGDPLRFSDGTGAPRGFASIVPEALAARGGCQIVMKYDGGVFAGGTEASACPSDLRGAAYASSQVRINAGTVVSWDRGFDAQGKQVWGATKGGYVFERVSDRSARGAVTSLR